MKKVYFIRHAKSFNNYDCKDIDRSINQKGEKHIKFMANLLRDKGIMPDIIISSNAKRAFQTAKIISDVVGFQSQIVQKKELYDSSLSDFLKVFHEIDDKFKSVFIIAHNPCISEICELLSNSVIDHIPTSSIFCIEFEQDCFKNIQNHSGKVIFFDYPKLHKNK
ncbi:SixA phosphatase family protein [Campylobacter sputorum]|uniref:SixA phosphatase family protein n=1 Tax=Campylobacter sputorum TaxID=206 RepID=UPI000B76CEAD|nr:histidine phosphatase family protein [Campylobacter sputorum]ASM36991.1 phosphohistidine phosphatase [Campylobacter sputorum bv. faecalis CCUG 20703]